MYVVESGRVRIEVRGGSADAEQVLGSLGPGDFFGEMSLMTGRARTADVIADEETTVLGLDRAAVQPALDQHPELAEHMSRVLAERQVRLDSVRTEAEPAAEEGEHDEMEILRRIRRFFTN
jgi:CRP-like cAMP-binding protein